MRKEVIAIGEDFQGDEYVLCWLPQKYEFASWFIGAEEVYYYGRYFKSLRNAIKDFRKRVCLDEKGSNIDWRVPSNWNEAQVVLFFELKQSQA